jgi:hypothetical protein
MDNTSNKKIWIIVVLVIVAILAWWMLSSKQATAPVSDTVAETDVNAELSGLSEVNLDAELEGINADINQL